MPRERRRTKCHDDLTLGDPVSISLSQDDAAKKKKKKKNGSFLSRKVIISIATVTLILAYFPVKMLHFYHYHQQQVLLPPKTMRIPNHMHRITTPLDPTKKFSFVHIAKCAGATWIRLLHTVLELNTCPEKEQGAEHSLFYQKKKHPRCKDADYTLISLRSPRHHVWSQFIMCKYSPWGVNVTRDSDFPRSGNEYKDDEVDFDSWLGHFVSMGNKTNNDLNCYHPLNMQTRALTSREHKPFRPYFRGGGAELNPNMTLAMNTYTALDFVALVEFVHESQCMLYYRLGNKAPPVALSYLSQSCDCEKQQGYLQKSSSRNGTVHVQHHNMGKRTNLRDLPPASLSKVANFISADSVIYLNALKHFMDEMAWLESDNALGRRVVCDDVLKKWEPELSYLDGGRFNVSQLYRNAVLKNEAVDPFLPSPSEAQQQWKSGRQRD